ncbi:sodium:proton antiporter [Bradymonadaceae bacterium TMQ3]|uniref:Sodium:proton antiporter n=1 Tax=Lujinxingia sediminis TaxID=2480984 RepID=A0ABY0CXJ5_9DELT|nr:hydrogen gas-evolving membrane-bound hydrogenase subunit E [Lujinxingia sediminis]RDV39553.1 sodium:proton antiporter [Bradymonadaceae bacterium TMQ3]RVU48403.1 sodium:proton antiporter [Lujinxingia sediminis]TXC77704.1 sodium:proton antiporter [Bradymonadales bacterium TMQ1]
MRTRRVFEYGVALASLGLGGLVALGALNRRSLEPSAGHVVQGALEQSGVSSVVTAVLLNFRAYDTMLEVVVLVVAFWGAWSLKPVDAQVHRRPADPILMRTVGGMLPVLWLLGIYLLWAGTSRPGGEFASGAVLGACGVLTLLIGERVPATGARPARKLVVVVGVLAFMVAGVAGALSAEGGAEVWSYTASEARGWILAIEVAGAATIAFVLLGLFAGGREGLDVGRRPGESL